MRVRIARKVINGLFTLLILNASLATSVAVSAASSNPIQKEPERIRQSGKRATKLTTGP